MVNNAGAKVDAAIWSGISGSVNGLLSQFAADATVIDVSGSASTSSNVIAEVAKVYDAIPATIDEEDDLIIVVSNNIAKSYKQAHLS